MRCVCVPASASPRSEGLHNHNSHNHNSQHTHSDCLAWLAWLFRALSRSLAKFMFVFENQVSKQPMDITKAVVQGEYLKQARRPHASIALARHACAVPCAAAAAAGMDARVR